LGPWFHETNVHFCYSKFCDNACGGLNKNVLRAKNWEIASFLQIRSAQQRPNNLVSLRSIRGKLIYSKSWTRLVGSIGLNPAACRCFASELKNIHLRQNMSMDRSVLQKREAIALVQGSNSNLLSVTKMRKSSRDMTNAWRRRSATVMQLMRFKDRGVMNRTLGIVPEESG